MIVAETVLFFTIACSVPPKRRVEHGPCYVAYESLGQSSFQMSSGVSLEEELVRELKNIEGVAAVDISHVGGSYHVNVTMGTYDFPSYEKVIEKEMEMFDKGPGSKCVFNVSFAEHAAISDSVLNAA